MFSSPAQAEIPSVLRSLDFLATWQVKMKRWGLFHRKKRRKAGWKPIVFFRVFFGVEGLLMEKGSEALFF